MKNFEIDARQIKAAMTMQAKNDIRYYLNGLLIGGGKVVATDGHRLIVVESPASTFEPAIFAIRGKIPARAMSCEFVFIGGDHGVVMSKDGRSCDIDAVVKFSIVDGRYPDYKRVIPKGKPESVTSVGFNIGYLADVHKASKALGSTFGGGEFEFHENSVLIKIKTPENSAKCVIMKMRL
jgi:DNA polymerase III sliding clamp (beta) subunit (PCNA family)